MEIINDIKAIVNRSVFFNDSGYKIGFVPTMGSLHEGHASLIKNIKSQADKVIVSIFINEKQFSKNEDYDFYPRSAEEDCQKCMDLAVDIVYMPTREEMYPQNFSTTINIGPLANELCGSSRKGYFNGILLVILKFIMQINPQVMIFGEKDYQMIYLITKMLKDLDIFTEIITSPTIREADGLALSSRNLYLTPEERHKANYLYNVLTEIARVVKKDTTTLNSIIKEKILFLTENGFKVDYIELRDNNTLSKITDNSYNACRIFAAAYLGKCRLIDNILIS